jgi:hypothetical protein
MSTTLPTPQVLIGPRSLDRRICRLMYIRETDEVWAEEWSKRAWVRAAILVRHLLKAPSAPAATLKRRGIPNEPGAWDVEAVHA